MTDNPYIHFVRRPVPGIKTEVWEVISNSSEDVLGEVKWFGRWRQYCFFPATGCVFNTGCMESIQALIKERMEARRG